MDLNEKDHRRQNSIQCLLIVHLIDSRFLICCIKLKIKWIVLEKKSNREREKDQNTVQPDNTYSRNLINFHTVKTVNLFQLNQTDLQALLSFLFFGPTHHPSSPPSPSCLSYSLSILMRSGTAIKPIRSNIIQQTPQWQMLNQSLRESRTFPI